MTEQKEKLVSRRQERFHGTMPDNEEKASKKELLVFLLIIAAVGAGIAWYISTKYGTPAP